MSTTPEKVKTLVVNKFNGRLTRFRDGDINSGMGNYYKTYGSETFNFSGTLSFLEGITDITGGIITDLVMDAKVRVESGITYVYAIGHTGRIYKIQVNDLATHDPDYDTPVLLTTLANGQTFNFGSSLDFYQGSTEKIWIGHDNGITKINFDGTGETNFLNVGWISNVPRQQTQFLGKLFFTNGSNLAVVDSSETVTTYTAITPGFPSNSQARDIDLTADGRYMVITVTRNTVGNQTSVTVDTNQIASMPSVLVYWNGVDAGASSLNSFPAFSVTSYKTFYRFEYLFGFQIGGAMLGTPNEVIHILEFDAPPIPNAIGSSGNFLSWASTFVDVTDGKQKAAIYIYGNVDAETPGGLYRQFIMPAGMVSGGDVIRVPYYGAVSSLELGPSTAGYSPPFNFFGSGKTYFSTLEYNGSSTGYGFYMAKNVIDGLTPSGAGVYETQHQVFSQKIKPTEVRVYFEPVLADGITSFQIDLVGIDGAVLAGGTKLFSPILTSQGDRLKFNPSMAPTSALGLRISNTGVFAPFIHKVEIDYEQAGN